MAPHSPGWASWMRAVCGCGVAAACWAMLVLGPGRTLAIAGPLVGAVVLTAVVTSLVAPDDARHRLWPWTWWAGVAASTASVVLVLVVVATLVPGYVPLVVAALAATTPPSRRAVRRRLIEARHGQRHGARPGPQGPRDRDAGSSVPDGGHVGGVGGVGGVDGARVVGVVDGAGSARGGMRVGDLTTLELCHLWRVTYWMLRETTSSPRIAQLAGLRQAIIDELESRHPLAVRHWLDSGHHLADGPARYL